KMLDAVGDLALAGAPVMGRYLGIRAGHGVTNRLLRKLFATEDAYEFVTEPPHGRVLEGLAAQPELGIAV
ncbi:MAG TPA: UDP-3-O-acyl-N-acetylglucosamine deacetylase, partial [Paracoccaceae bacterium]|nr:UDP-3-O-acyl-N-acetylglucosamine deacetylase [Paracoccaceae bacterium]